VPTKIFKRKPHATKERQKEEDFSLRARRNRRDARPTRPRERIKPTFTMASDKPIARFASEKNFSSSFIASFPLPFSASSSFRSRNNKPRKPFKSAFESFVLTYFEKFEEMSAQDIIVVVGFFFFASFFAMAVVVVFPFAKLSYLRVF
jgi:hypothetical protein